MASPRYQFRLSTLLWITLAVACWFGGMRFERWQVAQRFERLQRAPEFDLAREIQAMKAAKALRRATREAP